MIFTKRKEQLRAYRGLHAASNIIRFRIIKCSHCLSIINNRKLLKSKASFKPEMQRTNIFSFIDATCSQNSLSQQNLPFYFFYMNNNANSNMDYETYFSRSFANQAVISSKVETSREDHLKSPQIRKITQIQSPSSFDKKASQNNKQTFTSKNIAKLQFQHQKRKVRTIQASDDDYAPSDQSSFDAKCHKLSQTKNIPKNYGKAIIQFINKDMQYLFKVVQHCGFDFLEFMKYYEGMKKNFGSMAKLRSLWIDSENPYAKVFRIISKEYLRRHSLPYIFNSRVVNISRHIKYRYIIQCSIANPECFTHMKQY